MESIKIIFFMKFSRGLTTFLQNKIQDLQFQGKRPRFSIPDKILDPLKPKILKKGNIDDW
tara:strand:+ start:476 stop:655 length:180 start_codon:yes stop_codon:yes gene_type:complete